MEIKGNKIVFPTHHVTCEMANYSPEYMQELAKYLTPHGTPAEHRKDLRDNNNDGTWVVVSRMDRTEALRQIRDARKALTVIKASIARAEMFIEQFADNYPEHTAILHDESCMLVGSFDKVAARIDATEKTIMAID